uniref:Uncharacterized protein n=1 Tax=Anguilla anguilla TaxID=7936 RepID=A0A0E9SUU0_ANGAN
MSTECVYKIDKYFKAQQLKLVAVYLKTSTVERHCIGLYTF